MKRSYKLLAFGIAALSCGATTPAFADDPVTGSTDFTVTVNPYLNLTLSSADMSAGNIIHLPLTPSSSGTYGSKSLTATASTNNAYGYTLVMSTPHTYLESNTINVNDGTYPHIEAIESRTGGRTAAEFEANTYNDMNKWGISIDNTTSYNPIALTQNLKKVTTPVADSATVINMATVLDLLTPPGSYSTTMNFELVANAVTGSLEQALIDAGKEKVTVGNNKYYKIQDVNTAICNATTDTTSTLEVVDVRDNTIYHIGKLADQRCWLLDNLALDLTAQNISNNITPLNTNADQTSLDALFGTAARNATIDPDGNLATTGIANWTSSNSYSAPLMNASSKNLTPTAYSGVDDPLKDEATNGGWKVGGYYNYCAASAGSYCYGDGTSEGVSSGDASADICPSGWRMPSGDSTGEYQTLYDSYSGDSGTGNGSKYANFRKALHLVLSGDLEDGASIYQGFEVSLWSSTRYSHTSMYILNVGQSVVHPQNGSSRNHGLSIRCINK